MFGMSIRKFIILSALIVSGCISHPETIAIDFDSGTEDYTPLVRKILAEHPAGEVTIRFGAGTFDFYPEQAAGSYLCVRGSLPTTRPSKMNDASQSIVKASKTICSHRATRNGTIAP